MFLNDQDYKTTKENEDRQIFRDILVTLKEISQKLDILVQNKMYPPMVITVPAEKTPGAPIDDGPWGPNTGDIQWSTICSDPYLPVGT